MATERNLGHTPTSSAWDEKLLVHDSVKAQDVYS